jgi:hypothetical protein
MLVYLERRSDLDSCVERQRTGPDGEAGVATGIAEELDARVIAELSAEIHSDRAW